MTTPTYCTSCGHELGIGRFCTNCGVPVPGRHPAATPPEPAAPVVPPPVGEVPPAVRYPLYADTPDAPPEPQESTGPPPPPPSYDGGSDARAAGRGPAWLPWLVGALLVALVATVGGILLARSGGEESAEDPGREERTAQSPSTEETVQPDAEGTEGPVELPEGGAVVDLSRDAEARVPAVAPPSRDRQNEPVTFEAPNMLDGRTRTSWRMAGDGTGETITFDLGQEVVLTEVGIINGYAKVDGPDNWYRGNRRLRSVQWEFDDGTRITQRLGERRTLQTLELDPVRTSSVRLLLVEVSAPGDGPNGRDFTAVSEVSFRGAPA